MAGIIAQRVTANVDDEVVVFPIGMRTNLPPFGLAKLKTRLVVLLALLCVWTVDAAAAVGSIAALRDAVGARLLQMDDVARFKWNAQLPITDPEREAALLERTTASAVALGLPEDYARRVLSAQIEASRSIQSALFDRWGAAHQGKFADVADLATVQRPAIDRATTVLLEALARARCDLEDADVKAFFESPPQALADQPRAWSIATAALFTASPCPRPPSPTAR